LSSLAVDEDTMVGMPAAPWNPNIKSEIPILALQRQTSLEIPR